MAGQAKILEPELESGVIEDQPFKAVISANRIHYARLIRPVVRKVVHVALDGIIPLSLRLRRIQVWPFEHSSTSSRSFGVM